MGRHFWGLLMVSSNGFVMANKLRCLKQMKKLSDSKIEMCDCLSASRLRLQSKINPLDGGYSRPDVLGSRPCQSRTHYLVQGGSSELSAQNLKSVSQRLWCGVSWLLTSDLRDQDDAAKGPIQ